MGMKKIENYNKIIDISFYGEDNLTPVFTIKCPRKGIKPNIQITGSMLQGGQLFNVQVKIRNLYLDLNQSSFTHVKITAGYESKPVTFAGDIWYMYRENPGPESVTTIMIQQANINVYMKSNVNVHIDKNDSIYSFLIAMSKAAGYSSTPIVPIWAQNLTFPAPFDFNGAISDAVTKLKDIFQNRNIDITFDDTAMRVYSYDPDYASAVPKQINFLSTPPQLISDGSNEDTVATLTAPWDPSVRPGDTITCPATFYVNTMPGLAAASGTETINISVTSLQFQFSTIGSMNSMVIQGVS